MLGPRRNNKALTQAFTEDVADAISWHIRQGYSGAEFLFSKDGTFPVRINAHERSLHQSHPGSAQAPATQRFEMTPEATRPLAPRGEVCVFARPIFRVSDTH